MDDTPRDAARLRQIIRENGFAELEDYLMQYARPSIRLYTTRTNEDQIPLGQSKIGGRPDLPPHLDWARVPDRYGELVSLSFIAQINLSEVKPYDVENWLPETGILYFFNNAYRSRRWIESKNQCRIFYYEGDFSTLQRQPFPNDLQENQTYYNHEEAIERFFPCKLQFVPELNLPFMDANWTEPTSYPQGKTWEDYLNVIYMASYTRPRPPHLRTVNRLLGYNYDIPEDMQLDCEITTHESVYNFSNADKYQATKGQWQLLFQIGSDNQPDTMWGDAGYLCFYVRQDDLRHKRFDQAVVTMMSG